MNALCLISILTPNIRFKTTDPVLALDEIFFRKNCEGSNFFFRIFKFSFAKFLFLKQYLFDMHGYATKKMLSQKLRKWKIFFSRISSSFRSLRKMRSITRAHGPNLRCLFYLKDFLAKNVDMFGVGKLKLVS